MQSRADELETYLNKVENRSATNSVEQSGTSQAIPTRQARDELEQELTEKTQTNINARYLAEQQTRKNFIDGYAEDKSLQQNTSQRKLEVSEMNSYQLLSEGHRRLEKEKEE